MSDIPENRCGYTWPEDHQLENKPKHQSCCYRESLPDSSRCVWHCSPDQSEYKTVEELREQRETVRNRDRNAGTTDDVMSPDDSLSHDSEQTRPCPAEVLDGANLRNMSLPAEFSLEQCSLRDANLESMECEYLRAKWIDLRGSTLDKTKLFSAQIQNGDLGETTCIDAEFNDVHAQGSTFFKSNLSEAEMKGAVLNNAVLIDVTARKITSIRMELRQANLGGSDFSGSTLRRLDATDASWVDSDISGTDMWKATLERTDFTNSLQGSVVYADRSGERNVNLHDSDLSNANLEGAELTGATLERASIVGTNLSDATLVDANLIEAKLQSATLDNATFTEANLREARLATADCENVEFTKANLVRASLVNADLVRADLSNAYLFGTKFDGAQVSSKTQIGEHGEIGTFPRKIRCRYDTDAAPEGAESSLCLDDDEIEAAADSPRIIQIRRAQSVYRRLGEAARQNGLVTMQSTMFKRRQDMRRKLLKEKGERTQWVFAEAQRLIFDYGENFGRIVAISATATFIAWILFLTTGTVETADGMVVTTGVVVDSPTLFWETLYHSLSVFFTGQGLLTPTGVPGQILTIFLRATGPILIALLIFVLGRRAAR